MCITHGEKKHYKDRKSLKRQYLFHLPVKKASRSSSDLHTKKRGTQRETAIGLSYLGPAMKNGLLSTLFTKYVNKRIEKHTKRKIEYLSK